MKRIIILIGIVCFTSTLFAQNYKFGKVSKAELEEKFYPLDSTETAAYLYKKRRTYYEYSYTQGFSVVTKIHVRIKIYKKEGETYAICKIPYYNPSSGSGKESVGSIKAYAYNLVNNKIIKTKLSRKEIFSEKRNRYWSYKTFTVPKVNKGTVVEWMYTINSPNFGISDLNFQYSIPVKKLDYQIKIYEYFKFSKHIKGYYFITPKYSRKNITLSRGSNTENITLNVDSYQAENIPAIKNNEPYVKSINAYRGGMKYELSAYISPYSLHKYFSTTWADVSKEIYKSSNFGKELNKTSYYNDDVTALLQNATTPIEKISILFQFIKSKIKWNGTYGKYTDKGVKKAYTEGVGNVADINLMLTSMLRFAGLQANPVLISTRKNGVPSFPTLKGFNYVISMVEFSDGTYVLLDATEPYSLPNILPTRTLNWNGRIVEKNGKSNTISLKVTKHAIEDNNINIKITDDGIAEGIMRSKFTNHNALFYRKKYNQLTEDGLISKMEEKYNIEIDNFRVTNKQKIGKPISQLIKFTTEDLIENINGKLYVSPLVFNTIKTNPFKLEDRKFPIDFVTPWKDINRVSITIPEGYKVETIPASKAISLPDNLGIFKYQLSNKGNTIKTISILQLNRATITPNHYQILKEFYKQVVEKQLEKIVLIKN